MDLKRRYPDAKATAQADGIAYEIAVARLLARRGVSTTKPSNFLDGDLVDERGRIYEVKGDTVSAATGRFSIEVAERVKVGGDILRRGIFAEDLATFYVQCNRVEAFFFLKAWLRSFHDRERPRVTWTGLLSPRGRRTVPLDTDTVAGFFLPLAVARKHAVRVEAFIPSDFEAAHGVAATWDETMAIGRDCFGIVYSEVMEGK